MRKLKLYFVLLIFLTGCAISTTVNKLELVEKSASKMPDWIGRSYEDKDWFYFTGSASEKNTFEQAREIAIRDAVKKIIEYFGYTANVKFKRVLTEKTQYLLDEISGKSKEKKLIGIQIKDIYFERWIRSGETFFYNVHILLSYDKKEMLLEKQHTEDEERTKSYKVQALYEEGNSKLKNGYVCDAINNFVDALCLLEEDDRSKALAQAQDIESTLKDVLNTVNLDFIGGPKKINAWQKNNEPFRFRIYLLRNDKKLYAINCPVELTFVKGEGQFINNIVYSDNVGEIKVDNYYIKTVGLNKIKATLSLDKLEKLERDITDIKHSVFKEVEFPVAGFHKDIYVRLKLDEIIDGKISDKRLTQNAVSSRLENYGFKIASDTPADLIISGKIEIEEKQKNEIGIIAFTGKCEIKIEKIAGSKYLNKSQDNITGFGVSKEQSIEDTMNKMAMFIMKAIEEFNEK